MSENTDGSAGGNVDGSAGGNVGGGAGGNVGGSAGGSAAQQAAPASAAGAGPGPLPAEAAGAGAGSAAGGGVGTEPQAPLPQTSAPQIPAQAAPGAPGQAPPGWDPRAWQAHQLRKQRVASGAWSLAPLAWAEAARPAAVGPIPAAVLGAALASGLAVALLLGDGLGPGLPLAVVPALVGAYLAARSAGRAARPWTVVWALGCLALLAVPALRDSAWPSTLALLAAVLTGALALHGSRSWPGILLSPVGFADSAVLGVRWLWTGVRSRSNGNRDRWLPVVKAALVAVALLVLFGTLFASADAAFADLLSGLTPEVSGVDGPVRFLLFLLGTVVAVAVARTAAGPSRWDRIEVAPGKARSRVEWALPLVVLNLLFAGFNAVQLAVLFGGYREVLEATGLTYSEYARQGFWQLLWATLLTLAVIALALRWAPRGGAGDRRLVRAVLGTLCALTLVVVASALHRMDLYVDAYGLTRLRVSVAGMELWLGLVIVLIMAAGVFGARARWLPRAVAGSAVAAVLAFGLMSPDGMIAEGNVTRYERDGKIDLAYFQSLSADAVPGLDRLPEPRRSCALRGINNDLARAGDVPWYAMSLGERRARQILRERPVKVSYEECGRLGAFRGRTEH
ncbi:DUF4173 domain-containing protein [Streptomyces sp. ISL-43]|uniref:DUF4153 domain-containing protein n=1 Tax=Streptomyces sp. ISL-43 TaxID=2819183 RepID=UPI001BEAEB99|nr:DUF4173 domain-containing protein [Streptomyces sp. ISL-43]MBT2450343.1 DUF4173 domain-containing protein [Streptomyces sp. ISL-43]